MPGLNRSPLPVRCHIRHLQPIAQIPYVSPRFADAKINHNFRRLLNPYDRDMNTVHSHHFSQQNGHRPHFETNSVQEQQYRRSPPSVPQDQRKIPCVVEMNSHTLPIVNHDQALKRAKIQYSGLGDTFVFLQSTNELNGTIWYLLNSIVPSQISNKPMSSRIRWYSYQRAQKTTYGIHPISKIT